MLTCICVCFNKGIALMARVRVMLDQPSPCADIFTHTTRQMNATFHLEDGGTKGHCTMAVLRSQVPHP